MCNDITGISVSLIDNYIRIIQSIAESGRDNYQQYLIQPLSCWSSKIPGESMETLLSMIKVDENKLSSRLPFVYKMAIVKSVAPDQFDLSISGKISKRFLRQMKEIPSLLASNEAMEFIKLLDKPFKEYSEIEFRKMNMQFEKEMSEAEIVEVENLLKIMEGKEKHNAKIEEELIATLVRIEQAVCSGEREVIRKEVISAILKFSDPAAPDRHLRILEVLDSPSNTERLLKKEIMDAIAVHIYQNTLQSIRNGKLDATLKYISKYAVLFRGNPSTPHFYEVDMFEKKFFEIIEKKNLWDSIL